MWNEMVDYVFSEVNTVLLKDINRSGLLTLMWVR